MVKKYVCVLVAMVALTLVHCDPKQPDTIKLHPDDPFKKTIAKSEVFTIDSRTDNVVEAENGTVIVFPKGCFKNGKGEIVVDSVKIEVSEALSLADRVLSNLTTTSDGKLLETGGMIYFNATANDEQLTIAQDNPIRIEIPTLVKKPGMMAYQGVRDENGNMNWVNPKPLDNYLSTVDINSLDFLPEGFRDELEKNMPFRKYTTATTFLMDSLYYSLSVSSGLETQPTDYSEPYYNTNKEVKKGKYTPESYETTKGDREIPASQSFCGVDPAIIKAIKSEKYGNTFVATKEFEARLKVILAEGTNEVLEIYLKNLDKDLYVLDSLAALRCEELKRYAGYHKLHDFSQQRLTNVREADKYSKLLNGYYEKQVAAVRAELEKEKLKAIKALSQKDKESERTIKKYKKLLWKREKYRMETYGFTWTQTGWINIDNGVLPKNWSSEPLEVTVENGHDYDRVYVYVVYTSIQSLYRLNATDNVEFYAGNPQDKETLMPKREVAIMFAIGYKGDVPSIASKEFGTGIDTKLTVQLVPSTPEKVKQFLQKYDQYSPENRIDRDLVYMEELYKKEEQQRILKKQREVIWALYKIAYPNCGLDTKVMEE